MNQVKLSDKELHEGAILKYLYGSTAHGTNISENSDLDFAVIRIESPFEKLGFNQREVITKRDQPDHVRSEPGDIETVTYTLSKYISLLLKNNPTALVGLFARPPLSSAADEGMTIQEMAPLIVSKNCHATFKGYMYEQLLRLKGEKGQMNIIREELVEKHGFDTKYAGHIIRLGLQGIEILETGSLQLPMREKDRGLVKDVRLGKYTFKEVIEMGENLREGLDDAFAKSELRDKPDFEKVELEMKQTYWQHWRTGSLTNSRIIHINGTKYGLD